MRNGLIKKGVGHYKANDGARPRPMSTGRLLDFRLLVADRMPCRGDHTIVKSAGASGQDDRAQREDPPDVAGKHKSYSRMHSEKSTCEVAVLRLALNA